jgi:hypothetical protein
MTDMIHTAAAGQTYYPEMNGRSDGTALFNLSCGGTYVKWDASRHNEALAAFKANRIRPRFMHEFTTVKGAQKWSASVTYDAGRKLRHLAATEILLD